MKLLPSFRVLLFVAGAPLGALTIQNTLLPATPPETRPTPA